MTGNKRGKFEPNECKKRIEINVPYHGPFVRDVGVAGSNPATPTRYSLVALNSHNYLQLL
jgi:hypothetical protein